MSARTDLLARVTLDFLLTLATRGLPASGSFSVLLSSKLARLAMLRVVRLPRPRPLPRPPRLFARGVPSMRLVSVLLSSASRVWEVSFGEGGVTETSTRFWSSLLVSLNSAISLQKEIKIRN